MSDTHFALKRVGPRFPLLAVILGFLMLTPITAWTFATLAQGAVSDSPPTASPQSGEGRSAPEWLAADTPRMAPGGATFTAPSGWSIVTGRNLVILEPPETEQHDLDSA